MPVLSFNSKHLLLLSKGIFFPDKIS